MPPKYTRDGNRQERSDRIDSYFAVLLAGENAGRPARYALSPEELERRIAYYAVRFEQRLPLFEDGSVEPLSKKHEVLCHGCGDVVFGGRRAVKLGWRTRKLVGHAEQMEVYCPICFDMYGWGDDDIPQQPLVILRKDPAKPGLKRDDIARHAHLK